MEIIMGMFNFIFTFTFRLQGGAGRYTGDAESVTYSSRVMCFVINSDSQCDPVDQS